MSIHLFTYGSLMFEPVWLKVATQMYQTSIEQIDGFARYQVIGEDYPAAVQQTASSLEGRVYWDVSLADMQRLDRFEGSDYQRISAQTRSGKSVSIYCYLLADKISIEPWDLAAFEAQGMQRFINRYQGFQT